MEPPVYRRVREDGQPWFNPDDEYNKAPFPPQGETVIHPKTLAKRRKAAKAARKARKRK